MEISYCGQCDKRVSSVEIEQGRGIKSENDVYCHACAKKLGVLSEQSKPNTGSKQKRSTAARPVIARSEGRGGRSAPAVPGSNTMPIIIMLVIAVAVLGIALLFILNKEDAPIVQPSDSPIAETGSEPGTAPSGSGAAVEVPAGGGTIMHRPDIITVEKPSKKLPESVPPQFNGAGWQDLLSEPQKNFEAVHGDWELSAGAAGCKLDLNSGFNLLRTWQEFSNYELGLTFAATHECRMQIGFSEQGTAAGKLNLEAVKPGTWHTIALTMENNELKAAAVNGQSVLGQPGLINKPSIDGGTISITVTPKTGEEGSFVLREAAVKMVESHSIRMLLHTDRGENFPGNNAAVAEIPDNPEGAQYLKCEAKETYGTWNSKEDFKGYSHLVFDYYNPGKPFNLSIMIGDAQSTADWQWYNRVVFKPHISSGKGTCRIRLKLKTDRGRLINAAEIMAWKLFFEKDEEMYIRNLRLEATAQ